METKRISYCDDNGKFQKEYQDLSRRLVPKSGSSTTINGELIRAVSRLFWDYYTNGNNDARWIEYDEYGEESGASIPRFFKTFIDLIGLYVPDVSEDIQKIEEVIMSGHCTFNQEELDIYNKLFDKVVIFVVSRERDGIDSEIPEGYANIGQ